jgi:DnaJ-class molecular chaperone
LVYVHTAGKGDELPGQPPADLVFVVKQLPHERFTRQGNDLHTRVKVPLVAALTGGAVQVGGWSTTRRRPRAVK